MESGIFKTALLVLFLLLNGCEINEPTNPSAVSSDSLTIGNNAPPDTQSRYVRLFPLAEGARWRYSLYFSDERRFSSAGPYKTSKEYGQFKLDVVKEHNTAGGKIFELRLNLVVDSLYYSHTQEGYMGGYYGDTTYTAYNILDTVFTRTTELTNDTLWLRSNDSVQYMMPKTGIEGSTVSLDFYNLGRYNEFVGNLSFADYSEGQHTISYHRENPGGAGGIWKLDAVFSADDGGLSSLSSFRQRGGLSYYYISLKYQLLDYSPGAE